MGIVYADAVLSLRQYWKENGLADDPGKRSGLNKFYCFLQETDQSYNHETALAWLEQMKDSWRKQDYFKYRRALFELDDLSNPERPLFYNVIKGTESRLSPKTIEAFIQKYADEARATCPDIIAKQYSRVILLFQLFHTMRRMI